MATSSKRLEKYDNDIPGIGSYNIPHKIFGAIPKKVSYFILRINVLLREKKKYLEFMIL